MVKKTATDPKQLKLRVFEDVSSRKNDPGVIDVAAPTAASRQEHLRATTADKALYQAIVDDYFRSTDRR